MKRYIQHLIMSYHYHLAIWHDKSFKSHVAAHAAVFGEVHGMPDWSEDE